MKKDNFARTILAVLVSLVIASAFVGCTRPAPPSDPTVQAYE